jgi:hypothetical protein
MPAPGRPDGNQSAASRAPPSCRATKAPAVAREIYPGAAFIAALCIGDPLDFGIQHIARQTIFAAD